MNKLYFLDGPGDTGKTNLYYGKIFLSEYIKKWAHIQQIYVSELNQVFKTLRAELPKLPPSIQTIELPHIYKKITNVGKFLIHEKHNIYVF